jgi:hypothetical protein
MNPKDLEGQEKVTRGGEWESIKIPRGDLAYIPNRSLKTVLGTEKHSRRR